MTGRSIAVAILGVAVVAGGVGLAIAVRGTPPPAVPEPAAKPTAAPAARVAPAIERGSAAADDKRFHAPAGQQAKVPGADGAPQFPIPEGGYAAWTGREGTYPGDLEEFAKASGLRLPVALEQRRSTLLEERTSDNNFLAELLGAQPTGQMLATIGTQGKLLHEATADAQVRNREGTLSDDEAIRLTRAAEDRYRVIYREATGLSEQQFDRFFAPDRPFR